MLQDRDDAKENNDGRTLNLVRAMKPKTVKRAGENEWVWRERNSRLVFSVLENGAFKI
mgnify:CR=1 FL=1